MRKLLIVLIASAGIFSGCSDFLSKDPDNRTYIDTPEKVVALLTSAYPQTTFYTAVEARCDGYVDYGTAAQGYNSLFLYQEDAFQWRENPLTSDGAWDGNNRLWEASYNAVATANHALAAIDELEAQEGPSTQLSLSRGEALLCRAYAEFCLLTLFSDFFDYENMATNPGVPYVTTPETTTFANYTRGTVASTLSMVLQDIDEGSKLVGGSSDYTEPKFHFTTQSALALATRVALFSREYPKVINYVNQFFPATVTNYVTNGQKNQDGSLVQFPAEDDPCRIFCRNNLTDWNLLSSYNDNPDAIGQEFTDADANWNLLLSEPVTAIYRTIAANIFTRYCLDEQIMDQISSLNATGTGWTYPNIVYSYSGGIQGKVLQKYYEDFYYSDIVAGIGTGYAKVPLFRTDEMLLARAEAYTMTGQFSKAIDDLNLYIETRIPEENFDIMTTSLTEAKIKNYYKAQTSGKNSFINNEYNAGRFLTDETQAELQKALILTILDFRRIEFLYEGQRYYDILRWYIPVTHRDMTGRTSTLTPDDDRRILQIPQTATLAGLQPNPMTNIPQPW